LLHGMLHAIAAPSAEPYVRVTVLVNIWRRHQPRNVYRLPSYFARTLSNLPMLERSMLPVHHDAVHDEACHLSTMPGLPEKALTLAAGTLGKSMEGAPTAPTSAHTTAHSNAWTPVLAASLAEDTVDGLAEGAPWMTCPVGWIPLASAVEATPEWRRLSASMLGHPFRHLPLRLRHLPLRSLEETGRMPFVHTSRVELECDLWADGAHSQRKDWRYVAMLLAEVELS
jgi:hypothetical protein